MFPESFINGDTIGHNGIYNQQYDFAQNIAYPNLPVNVMFSIQSQASNLGVLQISAEIPWSVEDPNW
jgi:hypothetical protein